MRMKEEIILAKSLGASGIVLGILTPENQVDIASCLLLGAEASPLPVTFHKAIDLLEDPAEGVRQLKKVPGITRILTSGGKPTAKEGAVKIRDMIREAGDKIIILAAGKVTNENVEEIRQLTGASEFHGRKIVGELSEAEGL
jgi:copper homeostasis protein